MSADIRDGRGLARADRFDFERLEHSVQSLLKDHERLTAEREALMAELGDREHRIATLEARLEDERRSRSSALERVDRILSRVASLQAVVSGADPEKDGDLEDGTEGAGR